MQSVKHTEGMNERERFGALIRETREKRGLQSKELADRIGVSSTVMSYIETARTKSMPEPELLVRLEAALSLPRVRMLEAMGYLDPPSRSDEICIPASDPRARLLKLVEGYDDAGVAAIIQVVEVMRTIRPT